MYSIFRQPASASSSPSSGSWRSGNWAGPQENGGQPQVAEGQSRVTKCHPQGAEGQAQGAGVQTDRNLTGPAPTAPEQMKNGNGIAE